MSLTDRRDRRRRGHRRHGPAYPQYRRRGAHRPSRAYAWCRHQRRAHRRRRLSSGRADPRAIAPARWPPADTTAWCGGSGGVESDWSDFAGHAAAACTPPVQPCSPVNRRSASHATDPPEAGDRNVPPKAARMPPTNGPACCLRTACTIASRCRSTRTRRTIDACFWTRAVGRRDHGLRMAEGRVSIDSDSYVMQIGGDLLRARRRWRGRVGSMAGYGEARADSVSTLIRPDGTVRAGRAAGRGYAGGQRHLPCRRSQPAGRLCGCLDPVRPL